MTVAVSVQGVGKSYRFYRKPIDSLKELILRKRFHTPVNALSDISFEVAKGETLGVIGTNGAGKSTLLKLLAGTTLPSTGDIAINGRVSAILELGSGFHPDYSGIENIKIGCALLGLGTKEIEQRIPQIIAFSELGNAINRPVKTYSSGMYVRLAFSVVTAVDPDILVIDEALSVGDQAFQKKSLDRITGFVESGRTLIFCSHNLYQVNTLCQKAIWLEDGKTKLYGPAKEVTDAYQDSSRAKISKEISGEEQVRKDLGTLAAILNVQMQGRDKDNVVKHGDDWQVTVEGKGLSVNVEELSVGVVIVRNDKEHIYGTSTEVEQLTLPHSPANEFQVRYSIANFPLLSGSYSVYIYLTDLTGLHIYDMRENVLHFKVKQESREIGMAKLRHQWEF